MNESIAKKDLLRQPPSLSLTKAHIIKNLTLTPLAIWVMAALRS
jgi:hypothetical protein